MADIIWYTRCPVPTALSIALARGELANDLARDGISMKSLSESEDPRIWESHFDHTMSNSIREGGNIPPIWARSRGTDVRVVGMHWSPHSETLFALADSPIKTVSDLRGRRFGLPRRRRDKIDFWAAMGLRILYKALDLKGIPRDQVEVVDIDVSEKYVADIDQERGASLWATTRRFASQRAEFLALVRGECDATFSTAFRSVEAMQLLGGRVLVDLMGHQCDANQFDNTNPTVVTAAGSLCDSQPEVIARCLSWLIETGKWASQHHAETIQYVANDTVAAEQTVLQGYGRDIHQNLTPTLDEALISALGLQANFLLEHGFITNPIDLDSFVDHRPINLALAM